MHRSWTDDEIKQHLANQEETNNLLRQLIPRQDPDLLKFNKSTIPGLVEVQEPASPFNECFEDDVIRNRPRKRR